MSNSQVNVKTPMAPGKHGWLLPGCYRAGPPEPSGKGRSTSGLADLRVVKGRKFDSV